MILHQRFVPVAAAGPHDEDVGVDRAPCSSRCCYYLRSQRWRTARTGQGPFVPSFCGRDVVTRGTSMMMTVMIRLYAGSMIPQILWLTNVSAKRYGRR
mmetsp:Transcript_18211/g.39429  ORF Transcript_18211/g.39429 Transcript_18211/m.39429 type:complete len:98 (+) Transcript_18211:482-775(+)